LARGFLWKIADWQNVGGRWNIPKTENVFRAAISGCTGRATLKMRIELPEEIKGSDQLIVEARSVWTERDTNPEFFRTGFAFTSTFPHHAEIIKLLFREEESDESEQPDQISTRTE
jgi:hypothetical protein